MSIVVLAVAFAVTFASSQNKDAPAPPQNKGAPAPPQSKGAPAPPQSKDAAAPPASSEASACAAPNRTLAVDAIELCGGREVAGRLDLLVNHDGISYLFSTEANRDHFLNNPRAFEVADGGACGRMGPLAGLGDARRRLVHEGRIYFFASEGCRDAFRKDPAAYIERSDPRPKGVAEAVAEGARVMDRVVKSAGGADAWRRAESIRLASARERASGTKVVAWTWEMIVRFPDRVRIREAWADSWFSTTRTERGAAMSSSRGTERIAQSRAEAFDRLIGRMPVMILHAWAAQGAERAASGLDSIIAIDAGVGTIDGTLVRFVDVWLRGAQSRLAVDSAGKILRQSFHGREGESRVGEVARIFTAWTSVDGISVPTAWRVTINKKRFDDLAVSIDRVEVNPALAEESFEVPGEMPAPK